MRAAEACRSPLLRLGSRTQRVSSPDPEQEAWRRRSFVQWCTSVDLGLTRLQRTQHIQRGECPWSSILLFSSLPSLCLSTSLGSRSSTRFLPLRAPRRLNSVTRLVHELKSGMSSTRLHTLGQVTSSCARGYDLDIAKTRSKRYVGRAEAAVVGHLYQSLASRTCTHPRLHGADRRSCLVRTTGPRSSKPSMDTGL